MAVGVGHQSKTLRQRSILLAQFVPDLWKIVIFCVFWMLSQQISQMYGILLTSWNQGLFDGRVWQSFHFVESLDSGRNVTYLQTNGHFFASPQSLPLNLLRQSSPDS